MDEGGDTGPAPPYIAVMDILPPVLEQWFAARDWTPRVHQRAMLAAARRGDHALLVAPTGAGKTLAGFLPTLTDLIEQPTDRLHTLYVSPDRKSVV